MAEQDPTAERWLPVVGYEGLYEVSDMGRVRSLIRGGMIRKPQINSHGGHLGVGLNRGGSQRLHLIHRLVLTAFVGHPIPGDECDHLNFDRTDNRLSNLRWCTHSENVRHSYDSGRHAVGERHAFSKLDNDSVRAIRTMIDSGEKLTEVARRFCVNRRTVEQIAARDRWKHVK